MFLPGWEALPECHLKKKREHCSTRRAILNQQQKSAMGTEEKDKVEAKSKKSTSMQKMQKSSTLDSQLHEESSTTLMHRLCDGLPCLNLL